MRPKFAARAPAPARSAKWWCFRSVCRCRNRSVRRGPALRDATAIVAKDPVEDEAGRAVADRARRDAAAGAVHKACGKPCGARTRACRVETHLDALRVTHSADARRHHRRYLHTAWPLGLGHGPPLRQIRAGNL